MTAPTTVVDADLWTWDVGLSQVSGEGLAGGTVTLDGLDMPAATARVLARVLLAAADHAEAVAR